MISCDGSDTEPKLAGLMRGTFEPGREACNSFRGRAGPDLVSAVFASTGILKKIAAFRVRPDCEWIVL